MNSTNDNHKIHPTSNDNGNDADNGDRMSSSTQSLAEALLLELPDMGAEIAMELSAQLPRSTKYHRKSPQKSIIEIRLSNRGNSSEEPHENCSDNRSEQLDEETGNISLETSLNESDEMDYPHVTGDDSDGTSTGTNATMATSMDSDIRADASATAAVIPKLEFYEEFSETKTVLECIAPGQNVGFSMDNPPAWYIPPKVELDIKPDITELTAGEKHQLGTSTANKVEPPAWYIPPKVEMDIKPDIAELIAEVKQELATSTANKVEPPDWYIPPKIENDVKPSINENKHAISMELTAEELARDEKHRGSGESFLQHLPCFKLQQQLLPDEAAVPKCCECRLGMGDTTRDVYCRFYEFRRLRYRSDGVLVVTGFPNPYRDPKQEDVNIWQPDEHTPPTAADLDVQTCRYILLHAGDQFCYLWRQEFEAFRMHENSNGIIAWKKLVRGVREICDVCDTTLFNVHWTCDQCGFSVCAECVRDRKENRRCRKFRDTPPEQGRDEAHWLMCTGEVIHRFEQLMLTQIIAGNALNYLGELMHVVRTLWKVPQLCGCKLSHMRGIDDAQLEVSFDDMIRRARHEERWKAFSASITRENFKQVTAKHSTKMEYARLNGLVYVPGQRCVERPLGKDPIAGAFDDFQHINFLRSGLSGLRRFLPPRSMTLSFSQQRAPGVPHEWLCDGRLLRLLDPLQPDNRILFQEVWKCGQPVVISEVSRCLDLKLWHPQAFCRDFGEKPNDLINCLNGNLVPQQPMRHFWEGFQCINKRLMDRNGQPMLLKLKDWPPGDDFAEIMPSRFHDLMRGLPMPEYTLRTGHLNIASCLPKMFVPPDLGPKMYNAYGSALHPDKGTTNLHLDISDAVNIMVYVGIPDDADSKPQLAATQRAIAAGGCDFFTRYRASRPTALPGALWHIFSARDADKIRDLLNRTILERGYRLEPDHDPIHDQNWYLDDELRLRLFAEYGVESYPIVQCLGDAVFIPAGAPHQVQNLHNCIKVAEDFVSPENITHCYHLTHEFRRLSHSHTNHEDKLQIKNIIYHAIKDCCTILQRSFDKRMKQEAHAMRKAKKIKLENESK